MKTVYSVNMWYGENPAWIGTNSSVFSVEYVAGTTEGWAAAEREARARVRAKYPQAVFTQVETYEVTEANVRYMMAALGL